MKLYILIGLAMIAASAARVVREAPEAVPDFKMENFLEQISVGLKEIEKMTLDATGAADTEELKQRARDQFDVLTKQFNIFTDNIKEEADKLKESEMAKEIHETVDKHIGIFREHAEERIAQFKEDHPQTYNQMTNHIENFKSTSSAIASKIDGLAHSEHAQHLKEASIKFIDDVKEALMDVGKDIKPAGEKKA